jgi:hypothetical protein
MRQIAPKKFTIDVAIFFIKVVYLIFFFIVNREAIADNIRQIHWAKGGTSGTSEATIRVALARGANVPDPSDECMV